MDVDHCACNGQRSLVVSASLWPSRHIVVARFLGLRCITNLGGGRRVLRTGRWYLPLIHVYTPELWEVYNPSIYQVKLKCGICKNQYSILNMLNCEKSQTSPYWWVAHALIYGMYWPLSQKMVVYRLIGSSTLSCVMTSQSEDGGLLVDWQLNFELCYDLSVRRWLFIGWLAAQLWAVYWSPSQKLVVYWLIGSSMLIYVLDLPVRRWWFTGWLASPCWSMYSPPSQKMMVYWLIGSSVLSHVLTSQSEADGWWSKVMLSLTSQSDVGGSSVKGHAVTDLSISCHHIITTWSVVIAIDVDTGGVIGAGSLCL